MRLGYRYLFYLILFCNASQSQNIDYKVQNIEKCFLFEKSNSITIIDDMVLREPALIISNDCLTPEYSKGVFTFAGDAIGYYLHDSANQPIYDFAVNAIYENESKNVLKTLRNYEAKEIIYSGHLYSAIKIKLDYIYFGEFEIQFNENQNIVRRIVPIYFIVKINRLDGKQF